MTIAMTRHPLLLYQLHSNVWKRSTAEGLQPLVRNQCHMRCKATLVACTAACGLRLEFTVAAATAALAAPALPALETLIGLPLPPAELLARLARSGLDLVPRRPDAALLSRTCKVRPWTLIPRHDAGCEQCAVLEASVLC